MKMMYQRLTEYLLPFLPKDYRANFYSWIDQGKLVNQGKRVTEQGLMVGTIETQCIFWFEELPFRKIDPVKIMALIELWLNDNTPCESFYQTNDEIPFDLMLVDDNTADLQFTLNFTDPIYLQQAEGGEFQIEDENYRLEELEINYAENISVEVKIRHREKWQKQALPDNPEPH